MAALTDDEISAYASRWNPNKKDIKLITSALNDKGLADGILDAMRIERGEVTWPESVNVIDTERRRKDILAEVTGQLDRIAHIPPKMRDVAKSGRIVNASFEEMAEATVLALIFGAGALAGLVMKVLSFFELTITSWWIAGPICIVGWWLVAVSFLNRASTRREKLATNIVDSLASATASHCNQLQRIKSELEDSQNIDIIRTKEIANIHKASAVETAIEVGNVTKNVAAETAEITKNLIKEGQKLKAEHAASQVDLIDELAGNLRQPASQAHKQASENKAAGTAPADDRDARIAALQADIAKAEEIKALEAKLAALKGGA